MAGEGNSVSDRIVAAGLALLEEEGLKALTQTRIAKRSGLRQSHGTYYFPRIDNLLLAIFEASHRQAQQAPTSAPRDAQIGRAHVRTPVTNAHLVCRLLLEKKKK